MFVFNLTVKVETQIQFLWQHWAKTFLVPTCIETQCFYEGRVLQLISLDEPDGQTFAVQLSCHTEEEYRQFMLTHYEQLTRYMMNHFKGGLVFFHTLLQEV